MSDSNDKQDLELEPELELEQLDDAEAGTDAASESPPILEAAPIAPAAETVASDEGGGVEGQWVWQYGAPPPPAPWSAAFFSGTALKELYRFFGCGALVVLGCLLPWGPQTELVANDAVSILEGADEYIDVVLTPPALSGYETPAGAISLVIGLYLMWSAGYGIYTSRQKILPVFLMIEPAFVSWVRTADAWALVEAPGIVEQVQELFMIAGTGVMLTLVGSTWVAASFFLVVAKVYAKKDDKGAARRSSKSKDKAEKTDKGASESAEDGDAGGKSGGKGKGRRGRKR